MKRTIIDAKIKHISHKNTAFEKKYINKTIIASIIIIKTIRKYFFFNPILKKEYELLIFKEKLLPHKWHFIIS